MANKQIRYGIGFDVDKSGLQDVRQELKQIANMSFKELKLINKEATMQDLQAIKSSAQQLGDAFEKSFNPKLGTVNIAKFNQELKTIGFNVAKAEQAYAKMGTKGQSAFRNLTAEILTTQREIKQTNSFINSMAATLGNTIKWSIASSAINMFSSSIRNAWNYAVKLDSSLNDIRIVTEKSADDMEVFAKKANKAAGALGSATTAYTKASLIYYQQGLSEKDVQARTDVTIKAANVTGQSAAEVSEQLTAVWNGYKVVAEEAELYVDKLSAVAASTAADLEELSEGMSKVASGANAMGVDIDQLTAQLSTIVSVTRQDASSVGTALKTIYARMGDLKVDGVDEFGVSLGEVSNTLKQVGIEVLDQEGNLREMGNVMEEVAGKWGTWTEAQQQAIAVAMAGKRQYNNLLALFENWDMYESALTTSKNSAGTLQKQQDIYMESIEARLNNLSVAGERVFDAFLDSNSMKDLIDVLSTVTQGVANFIEAIGGGGNLLLGLGSIATNVFSNKIAGGIMSVVHNLGLAKEYQRQYQAELEITSKYSGASDETIQKMVSLKEEELKYSKLLTEEQKQQFEYYIKQTNELANQTDEIKDKREELQAYYQEMTGDERTLGGDKNSSNGSMVSDEHAAKHLKDKAKEIESIQIGSYNAIEANKSGDRVSGKTQDLESRMLKMTSLNAKQVNQEELVLLQEELSNRAVELTADFERLQETGALTTEEIEYYTNALDKAVQSSKGVAKIEKELKNLIKNRPIELNKNANAIENLSKQEENLKNKTIDLKKAQEGFLKSIHTQALIGGITKVIGAIGQLTTAWSMFQNLGSIWSDESISEGERWLQLFMNIVPAIGMAASGLKSFGSALTSITMATNLQNTAFGINLALLGLNKELSKAATEEDKKAILTKTFLKLTRDQATAATAAENFMKGEEVKINGKVVASNGKVAVSVWSIVWPLLAVAAAAAAVIGIFALISSSLKDNTGAATKAAKKNLEEMQESAKKASENLKSVKNELASIIEEFDNYASALNTLDQLVQGTEEWNEAVLNLNSSVLDLLQKYPTLAEYIKTNDKGVLTITQEGQDALVMEKQAEVQEALRNNIAMQMGVLNAQTTVEQSKLKDTILDTFGLGEQIIYRNEEEKWKSDHGYGDSDREFANFNNIADYFGSDEFTQAIIDEQKENPTLLAGTQTSDGEIDTNSAYFQFIQDKLEEKFGIDEEEFSYTSNELATALTKNVEATENSVKAMNKQIVATNALNKTYLRNLADELGIDDEETFANVSADDLAKSGVKSVDELKKNYKLYGNGGERDTNLNTKADKNHAVGQANEWVTKVYGEGYSISRDDFDDVDNLDEFKKKEFNIGNGLKVTGQDIIDGSANEDYLDAVEKATQKNAQILKQLESTGKDSRYAYFMGDNSASEWSGKNLSVLEKLENDADLVEGVDKDAINTAIQEMEKKISDTISSTINVGGGEKISPLDIFTQDELSEFSEEDLQNLKNNFYKAYMQAGQEGVAALSKAFDLANGDADLTQKINDIFIASDLSTSSGIATFIEELEDLGVTIDYSDSTWTTLFNKIVGGLNLAIEGVSRLRNALKFLSETIKDVKIGEVISEEDYLDLVKINPAAANYFVRTATGYMATSSGSKIVKDTKSNLEIQDTQRTTFKAAVGAVNNADNNTTTSLLSESLETTADAKDFFNTLQNIKNSESILSALGLKDSVSSSLNILNNSASTDSEKTQAFAYLKVAAESVKNFLRGVETGEISDKTIEETFAIDYAESWDDAKKYDISNNTRVKSSWRAKYLSELGFEGDIFSDTFDNEALQTLVENNRKLNQEIFDELEKDIENVSDFVKANKQGELKTEIQNQLKIAQDEADAYSSNLSIGGLNEDSTIEEIRAEQAKYSKEDPVWKDLQKVIDAKLLVEELADKDIEIKFDMFNTALQLKLDLTEAKRQWNDFKANYIEKTGINLLEDLTGQELFDLANKQYQEYENDFKTNIATLAELGSFDEEGNFVPTVAGAENTALFWEAYNSAVEGAQVSFEEMFSQAQEMSEAYLSIQEEIVEIYDKQTERIENINDLYSNSVEMLSLLNKGTSQYSDKINEFLLNSTNNAKMANEIAMEQLAAAQTAYEKDYENATKEQKELLEENLTAASQKVLETNQALLDAINTQFQESLTQAIDNAFGTSGLQGFTEEWNRDLYFDERYLDETNKVYSLSELERKIQKSIDETDSYSAQKKLNKLKEQELEILAKKDKLTQADLDRANARYELELKRIALEEAQQTANKMKLTRDASGNYSYQYVQDQDAIAQAQEEFDKAENDLYNLNKNQERETINLLTQKYQEAMEAIGGAQTAEEKDALNQFYFGTNGVITLLEADLAAIGREGELTGTYTSQYKDTIDRLLKIEPQDIGNQIKDLIGEKQSGTGFAGAIGSLENSLNDIFGEDGALINAINSLENLLPKKEGDEEYYYKNIFDSKDGMLSSASNILTELTKENGILATISAHAATLSSYMGARIEEYNAEALDNNTEAIKGLTSAILMQQDLLDNGKIDGNLAPNGWIFNNGIYDMISEEPTN